MDDILEEFQVETRNLLVQMIEFLESVESDAAEFKRLEDYGQVVDRIMGTAKSLLAAGETNANLKLIGELAAVGKLVGYKGSQVGDNPELVAIVAALLLDATELLQTLNENLLKQPQGGSVLSATFLDRLSWVSKQFDSSLRGTLASNSPGPTSDEFNDVLRRLSILNK